MIKSLTVFPARTISILKVCYQMEQLMEYYWLSHNFSRCSSPKLQPLGSLVSKFLRLSLWEFQKMPPPFLIRKSSQRVRNLNGTKAILRTVSSNHQAWISIQHLPTIIGKRSSMVSSANKTQSLKFQCIQARNKSVGSIQMKLIYLF